MPGEGGGGGVGAAQLLLFLFVFPRPPSLYNDILFASIGGGAAMSATVVVVVRASERAEVFDDAIAVARSSRIPSSLLYPLPSPAPLPARSLSLVLPEDHGWREATFRQGEEFDRQIEDKKMKLDFIRYSS